MLTLLSRVVCAAVGVGFVAGVVLYILRLAHLAI
jgi:hypothetical protein